MVLAMINTVFAQETLEAAIMRWRVVADQLCSKFSTLAAMLDRSEGEVLPFMSFPKAYHKQIHSIHPLERLNAEIKRRTDVVGIFPNEAAIMRLVGALRRATSRVYSGVTCSEGSSDNQRLGCALWSTEHESNRTRTHDSYTTPWDAIGNCGGSARVAPKFRGFSNVVPTYSHTFRARMR